ncbi:MAG: roadblock/LC7 domain-containing protein [Candidatus Thorarchaeota archaeon]
MSLGTIGKLELVLDEMVSKTNIEIGRCVVTNERGLIVAEKKSISTSNETLAAMISLLSDTALRINRNLGLNDPNTATIESMGTTFSMCEFPVNDRRFRIGVITEGNRTKFKKRIFLRRRKYEDLDETLRTAAKSIQTILEG